MFVICVHFYADRYKSTILGMQGPYLILQKKKKKGRTVAIFQKSRSHVDHDRVHLTSSGRTPTRRKPNCVFKIIPILKFRITTFQRKIYFAVGF